MAGIICPICLEKLQVISSPKPSESPWTKNNSRIRVTQCGHLFHSHCLQDWLTVGKTQCPTCRSPLNVDKLINLYPQYDQVLLSSQEETLTDYDASGSDTGSSTVIINQMQSAHIFLTDLEQDIDKISEKISHSSTVVSSNSNCSIGLNIIGRILQILESKPSQERNSKEREILDLIQSIKSVNTKMDEYSEKILRLTGIPKAKNTQEEYAKILGKLNRAASEHLALKKTLETKVLKSWPKDVLELLNCECNRLSKLVRVTMKDNLGVREDLGAIQRNFGIVKNTVAGAIEKLRYLQ